MTTTLLLFASGTALAQQADNPQAKLDKLITAASQAASKPPLRVQAAPVKLSTPASIMDYLFPARPLGGAAPMAARQANIQQRASGEQLPSEMSAAAAAQQAKANAAASTTPTITPAAQGVEPVAAPIKPAVSKK
ncbi:hypothetical protein WJU16_18305 [Chitinophaga pollutisoli]|uniref:Uncharacterized protein n=1 Tax=Chitinophaga pollutisoli TaxID=3133966 RepID=A0ABZ2YK99_9BACT